MIWRPNDVDFLTWLVCSTLVLAILAAAIEIPDLFVLVRYLWAPVVAFIAYSMARYVETFDGSPVYLMEWVPSAIVAIMWISLSCLVAYCCKDMRFSVVISIVAALALGYSGQSLLSKLDGYESIGIRNDLASDTWLFFSTAGALILVPSVERFRISAWVSGQRHTLILLLLAGLFAASSIVVEDALRGLVGIGAGALLLLARFALTNDGPGKNLSGGLA